MKVKPEYVIVATTKGGERESRLEAESWPSVCGHLGHMKDDYENVIVIRQSDDVLVLRYDADGFDL